VSCQSSLHLDSRYFFNDDEELQQMKTDVHEGTSVEQREQIRRMATPL
jgi:hypothetical protein